MKYSIYIDQISALAWGLNTQEAILFDLLTTAKQWATEIIVEDATFYWVSKSKVIAELPAFFASKQRVQATMRSLEQKGLLTRKLVDYSKGVYRISEKGALWGRQPEEVASQFLAKATAADLDKASKDVAENEPCSKVNTPPVQKRTPPCSEVNTPPVQKRTPPCSETNTPLFESEHQLYNHLLDNHLLDNQDKKTKDKKTKNNTERGKERSVSRKDAPPKKAAKAKTKSAGGISAEELVANYEVGEQVAKDWLLIRKKKRLLLTETAMAAIEREAAKAGISVAAAITFSVVKGWAGFEADWYESRASNQANFRDAGATEVTPSHLAAQYASQFNQKSEKSVTAAPLTTLELFHSLSGGV